MYDGYADHVVVLGERAPLPAPARSPSPT